MDETEGGNRDLQSGAENINSVKEAVACSQCYSKEKSQWILAQNNNDNNNNGKNNFL